MLLQQCRDDSVEATTAIVRGDVHGGAGFALLDKIEARSTPCTHEDVGIAMIARKLIHRGQSGATRDGDNSFCTAWIGRLAVWAAYVCLCARLQLHELLRELAEINDHK